MLLRLICLTLWGLGAMTAAMAQQTDCVEKIAESLNQSVIDVKLSDSAGLKNAFALSNNCPCDSGGYRKMLQALNTARAAIGNDIYFAFRYNLVNNLNKNRVFYYCISETKRLIGEIDQPESPVQNHIRLSALAMLRNPYRNSDSLHMGISYFLAQTKKYENLKDSDAVSISYYSLRALYYPLGLIEKAIYFQKKSLQYLNPQRIIRPIPILDGELERQSIGVMGMINRKAVLGHMLSRSTQPEQAIIVLNEARQLAEKYRDSLYIHDIPFIYLELLQARLFAKTDSLDEYAAMADAALVKSRYDNEYQVRSLSLKAELEIYKKNYSKALQYASKAVYLYDSLKLAPNSFSGILLPRYFQATALIQLGQSDKAQRLIKEQINILASGNLKRFVLDGFALLAVAYEKAGMLSEKSKTLDTLVSLMQALNLEEQQSRTISFETEQALNERELKILDQNNIMQRNKQWQIFLITLLVLCLLIALLVYRGFLNKQRYAEKLKIQKDQNEKLLLNILPQTVADELIKTGETQAKFYDNVTVMFTDFENFTGISQHMPPGKLVEELNNRFKIFDGIIQKHGLEKIKTIGDAYMAVAGAPLAVANHAEKTVRAALELMQWSNGHDTLFKIRIGIYSGPVVAGVVGTKKYAYDIWGDTVNTASRMEHYSEPGKINIGQTTYNLVKEVFKCTHRGKIEAKNKGHIDMYFVDEL